MSTDFQLKISQIEYTDSGKFDILFWQIFDELKGMSPSGEETVKGQELKARLVSTNKFFVGDAVLIIQRMERTGQIEKVGFDTYRKLMMKNEDE
jgi:hypothetical protein